MIVVADSSALVALAASDTLSLLDQLFQTVCIPPAVFLECTVAGKPEAARLEAYLEDKVAHLDLKEFVIAAAGLGQGELEAMALYKVLHADRLLIDDDRARRVARHNGIEVIGSLGVLLRAKESGMISELRPLLTAMRAAGLYYGNVLLAEALRLAGE